MGLPEYRTMQEKGFLAKQKLGKVWIAPLCHILEESTQENTQLVLPD